jgi:adenylosuccinate synthase
VAVGKTAFGDALLSSFNVRRVSTRNYIIDRLGTPNERGALQAAGTQLDTEAGGAWVADAVAAASAGCEEGTLLLVDSVRIVPQVTELRARYGQGLFHVHLRASDEELSRRYLARRSAIREFATYAEVKASVTEAAVGALAEAADIVLDADNSGPAALVAAAMAAQGSYAQPLKRLVDVIVGGQYGSEGKGNICAYLASEYDVLMRVGGPNAGHMVASPYYKYVQLPSGTGSNTSAAILVGAGSTLWLPQVMKEIIDLSLSPERLSIDPLAMVIDDEDRRIESKTLSSIASTKQGVGMASARKIMGRGKETPFGPPVRLARDVKEIAPFVRDTKAELEQHYARGRRVLLEGTQGTDLSIHHGLYPHVTSRETSSSGCLSDAGIAPGRVERVIMVTRTYPIRVGGDSGPMGCEIQFDEVARRSGVPLSEIEATEVGTISGNRRRMAEFDWARFRQAIVLNGATEIALTFADYLDVSNRKATCYSDLSSATRAMVERRERSAGDAGFGEFPEGCPRRRDRYKAAHMTQAELVALYPRLWHMAHEGSWPSIRDRGLMSVSAILDAYNISGEQRIALESTHRPDCVTLRQAGLPPAVLRDQKPMSGGRLEGYLDDGLSVTQWYEILNARSFFWLSSSRIWSLLKARAYRASTQTVLTIDTASLVAAHSQNIWLSPINSGSALFKPQRRGLTTFQRIPDFPFEERRLTRCLKDAVVELVVDHSVPDIADHVLAVHTVRGTEILSEIWRSPRSSAEDHP